MAAVPIYAVLCREELLLLTTENVDLRSGPHGEYGMLRIRAKTVEYESRQFKPKVNRAVPISRDLRGYLDRYTPRVSDQGWYFTSPDGKRWDCDNFSQDPRAAITDDGLTWACLDSCHIFGSQLAQAGVRPFKIATLMGNSPEICQRHYAALVPEAMQLDVEFRQHHQAKATRF